MACVTVDVAASSFQVVFDYAEQGIEADLSSVRLALHQKGSLFTPS